MGEKEFRRIVAAVDLSAASGPILAWAGRLAQVENARLAVFHAFWIDFPPYFSESQLEEFRRQAADQRSVVLGRLRDLVRRHVPEGVEVQIAVEDGHALEALVRYLDEENPDLIVMGSHGRTGLARLMLGSVAENVLRSSRQPVLVVRGESPPERVEKVLVPVNFTPTSPDEIETACRLSRRLGAQLIVVHALEKGGSPEECRERLCAVVPESVRRDCRVLEVVREGNAAEQIVQLAREQGVQLVIMAAEHKPFLEFTTLGTTTERVVRHCSCPVLVWPRVRD